MIHCDDGCRSFGDAHRVHHIRARRAGETPWGWRDGVVESAQGGRITVRYVVGDVEVVLEHHRGIAVSSGHLVRVHEEFRLLEVDSAWLGVAIEGGLGAVPRATLHRTLGGRIHLRHRESCDR